MPNHVSNRLTFIGDLPLDKIGTFIPELPRNAYDGNTICCFVGNETIVGWYDEKTGRLEARDYSKSPDIQVIQETGDLPDGWKRDMVAAHFEIDFEKIIPPPDDPAYRDLPNQDAAKDSPNWWYTWNIKNWGTKWGAYDCCLDDQGRIRFDTAWSPPTLVIEAISKLYPEVSIMHEFIDEGWGFAGLEKYENGIKVASADVTCKKDNPIFCLLCLELKGYDPSNDDDDDEGENEVLELAENNA